LEQEREEKQRLEQQNESLQAALRRQERQRDKEKEEEAQKLVDQQKQLANQRNQLANQQSQLAKERRDRALQEAKVREANRQEQMRIEQEQMRIEQEKRDQIIRDQWKRQEKLRKLKMISPDSLYALRELIRKRYELDVKIWNLKGVKKADRGIVENMMEKADAVMMEITNMVRAWEGTESSWTKREWGQAMEIQKRILSDGKRSWLGNPPWDDQEEDSDEWEF